jgi:hypothetical protein
MTLTLELPPELESQLTSEASQIGLPLPEYILGILTSARRNGPALSTGSELVDYWRREGVIGDRPDIPDSQQRARTLRQQAERRERT